MRKRALAALICLALLVMLLPSTALAIAGNSTEVWIHTETYYYGDQHAEGAGWKLDFTPNETRLTLNGYVSSDNNYKIHAYNGALTIVLVGYNHIRVDQNPGRGDVICVDGNLRIIGDGTLDVSITVNGTEEVDGIESLGSITIENATVRATSDTGSGILAKDGCTIINADVTGTSETGTGVEAGAGIAVTGARSRLHGEGGHGSIVATNAISGRVKEPAGGYIGINETLFAPISRYTVYDPAGTPAVNATLLAPVYDGTGVGDGVPKTGDSAPVLPLCGVVLLSGATVLVRAKRRKRKA